MENMKNTIGLVRISTILQTEENGGTGVQFQTDKLTQYSNLNDFNLSRVITDVASGGLETRDGVEELKSLIETGGVDVVLIWNVSRAFRSMIGFSKFYEFLKQHDIELISVSEGIRSSSKTGNMMFGIMVSIASFEKDVITERMMSGRYTKVSNGVRGFGSKVPFGYVKNTDGDIMIDDEQSKIVQYIFKKYNSLLKRPNLTKSKRTRTLLKLLVERGFRYNDKNFTRWNIRDILNNQFYTGVLKYGDVVTQHNYQPIVSKRLFNQICIS